MTWGEFRRGRNIYSIPDFDPVASDHSAAIKAAFEDSSAPWVIPPDTEVRVKYGTNIDPPDGWALHGENVETSVLRLSGFTAGDSNQSNYTYNVFGAGAAIHGGTDATARRLTVENVRIVGTKGAAFVTNPQQQPSVFGMYGKVPTGQEYHPYHLTSFDAYDWVFRRVIFEDIEGFTVQPTGYAHRVLYSECVQINCNNGLNPGARFMRVEKSWFIKSEGVELGGYGSTVDGCFFIEPKLAAIVIAAGNTVHASSATNNLIVGGDCDTSIMVADDGGSGEGVIVSGNRIAYAHGVGIHMAADRGVCCSNVLWDIGQSSAAAGARIAIQVSGADNLIHGNQGYSSSPKLSGLKELDGTAITLTTDGGIKVEGLRNRLTLNKMRDMGTYDVYFGADSRDTFIDASNDYNPAKLSIQTGATFARGSWLHFNSATFPDAGAGYRGVTGYFEGGAGVADLMRVCRKASNDAYAWADIA